MKYFIKRINVTADDVTIIGKRFVCGSEAKPFDSMASAERACKRQQKQDEELCSDCLIRYELQVCAEGGTA